MTPAASWGRVLTAWTMRLGGAAGLPYPSQGVKIFLGPSRAAHHEATWAPTHGPLHPRSRPAPGSREPQLGISADPRRAPHARHRDRFHRDHHHERATPVRPSGDRARHQAGPRVGGHRSPHRKLGSQATKNLMMDPGRCGLPGTPSDPRSGWEVPRPHGRDPRRTRHQDRAHRHPNALHELGHGTVGAVMPPRTPRPLPPVERTPPTARPARVRTLLQSEPRVKGLNQAAPSRTRSQTPSESPTRTYTEETGSAEFATSTHMQLELHGWNFRRAHRHRASLDVSGVMR